MRAFRERSSLLELGALFTVASFALAGILGIVAVLDADNVAAAFGTGLGAGLLIFVGGATVTCGLACLRRGRADLLALGGIVTSALALDLLLLAIALDIESETYAKVVGIGFSWSFFAFVILGLVLALGVASDVARMLFVATAAVAVVAGLVTTWLIATTGNTAPIPAGGPLGVDPGGTLGDDSLLRVLGVCFVLLAALWFAALAASRIERSPTAEV